jgi:hypothetical protein
MSINPQNKKKILVIHGVARTDDKHQLQNEILEKNINDRLTMDIDYYTEMFRYEDINDKSKDFVPPFFKRLTRRLLPYSGISALVDVLEDIVIVLKSEKTSRHIVDLLKANIMDNYNNEGAPLTIVAHSLGSIYAFDAINELMLEEGELFNPDDRTTWPVQSLVTLGSPLGLKMFEREKVISIGNGANKFRWYNFFSKTDPIVSGTVLGTPIDYKIAENFADDDMGWEIHDIIVDTGSTWLSAHVGYWKSSSMADNIIHLLNS